MDDEDRYTRITLRIPKDLHKRLSDSADETSKSLNAEIVARLNQTFQPTGSDVAVLERALDVEKDLSKVMATFLIVALDAQPSTREQLAPVFEMARPMARHVVQRVRGDEFKGSLEDVMIAMFRHVAPPNGKTWESFVEETLSRQKPKIDQPT